MHVADIHLGYQQYGSKERFNDFSQVFLHIVDQAVQQQVDFFLLAGDLFEKCTVDPLAMRVAIEGFGRLRDAGIPVVAVEGNHEKAHYRDQYSWVDFLDALGYLCLLNPHFESGRAVLEPYSDGGGAYVDLPGGVRVYGLKYYGASTGKVFGLFADALEEVDHGDVDFSILVAHAGLEGQMPRYSGTLTYNDLAPLRERIDYLALGHIHKPYAVDGWIYNPGSPETRSVEEVAWSERGYYLVDVELRDNRGHRAELVVPPRRPFHRLRLEVDALAEPNAVYDAVRKLIKRKDGEVDRDPAPIVELTLSGVLPFNRFDLDLDYVKSLVDETWSPLVTRVQNGTTPAEFEITVDTEASRPELEHAIIRDLFERDARFRPAAEEWAQVAIDVKRLALEGSSPEAVIDCLRRARRAVGQDGILPDSGGA
jgi:DNA repair exonuclease SbcCD nuclease subunit